MAATDDDEERQRLSSIAGPVPHAFNYARLEYTKIVRLRCDLCQEMFDTAGSIIVHLRDIHGKPAPRGRWYTIVVSRES